MSAETVGQRIRRLRAELGLSQRDLAVPGVSYSYISRVEAGTRGAPSVKALRRLAPKLGVTPEYLETGEDPPDPLRLYRAAACALERLQDAPDVGMARVHVSRILDELARGGVCK